MIKPSMFFYVKNSHHHAPTTNIDLTIMVKIDTITTENAPAKNIRTEIGDKSVKDCIFLLHIVRHIRKLTLVM